MSGNDGDQQQQQQQNANGAASYFNNAQDFIPSDDPGWQQPDLVAPGNVGNNQQLGYHNPGDYTGGGASYQQPVFYNPEDLKNAQQTGQEQYQGHAQYNNQLQWNYAAHADPNVQWNNQDVPNVAGNLALQDHHFGPCHIFYPQNNDFGNPHQKAIGENADIFANGPSDLLHNNYPGEHADGHVLPGSLGNIPPPSQGQYERNPVEQQMDALVDQPLGDELRNCGQSVPDIVSNSKDGNPSGQEYTDVVPQQQQHGWFESSLNPSVSESNSLQPNLHCNNFAHEGLDFNRLEPDLAPEIRGEPVRFEPDRMGPDLGMSSMSPPMQHNNPSLPEETGISVGPHVMSASEDLDKRSDHSGSRSSSMMGLSVSDSSHSEQHSRSNSLIGEGSSEVQHPPEHLPASGPTGVEEPLDVTEDSTHHQSNQPQMHVDSVALQNAGSLTQDSSAFPNFGVASILDQSAVHKNSENIDNPHSNPDGSHMVSQDSVQTVHFQPDAEPPVVAASQENVGDNKPENPSPEDLSRMRHKSTEEVDHLVQGGAHPSAFTTVKAGRGGAVVQQKRVMPSPPLWSAEVPALPNNIQLTTAAPAPVAKPVLPSSGIPTCIPGPAPLPVVFSSTGPVHALQPTPIQASTSHSSQIAVTNTVTASAPLVASSQISPPMSMPQTPSQQFRGSPMVNVAPPKPLPASVLRGQAPTSLGNTPGHSVIQPPVPLSLPTVLGSQPQASPHVQPQTNPQIQPHVIPQQQQIESQAGITSQITQGVANMNLDGTRISATTQGVQQQYPSTQPMGPMAHQGVQQYAQYPEGYQQGRHRGYAQFPPHQNSPAQGHYPERSTSRGPYAGYGGTPYDPYGQGYDPYYGYQYSGQRGYNRKYYEDYYRQQEYARRRYYSRRYTDPYNSQYDYNRPRSRQDTTSPASGTSDDRPSSRGRDDADAYSRDHGQARRGYDEHGRQTSYDRDQHRNSHGYPQGYQYDSYQDQEYRRMQQQYYAEYYRSQQNNSRGAEDKQQTTEDNSSLRRMQQNYYDEYYRSQQNTSRGSIDLQYDNASFANTFHHTGGNTPEGYNQDMSSISKGSSLYEQNQDVSQQAAENTSYDGYNEGSFIQPTQVEEAGPPQRRTPTKFSLPHIVGRFSPGGHLLKVLPNSPTEGGTATVEIHSIQAMLEHTADSQELRAFPGPLIRNETHKGDVISFASKKVKSCREDTSAIDKESATLLWDLMVLLCRQNGTVVGTDMSELILNNHPVLGSNETEEEEADSGTPTNSLQHKKAVDVEKETRRFRELLLFGRKKDALENAIRSGLWGHALLLATKMDHRTHTSVMTRFANSLPMNDPLQTLYQLMSDRQPAAVTSCSDVNWGDWRPHLAMVLSNLSSNAELDKKSIITLGDSLGSRGLVHASHFCYLMVQLGLGTYNKKSSKMVLVGSSHGLPFNQFSTNEAIQQTEVYEYAQHLANKHYTMPNYIAYKFIYACRLAEYGFIIQALHYCEVIAKSIAFLPTHYSETLVSQVCQMSDRLKYHDLQYFDGRELTQPQWLKDLENVQQQIMDGRIQPASNPETPMPWVESFSNLSNLADTEDTASTPSTQYDALPTQEDIQQIPDMDKTGFYQPTDTQGNQSSQYFQQQAEANQQQPNQQYDYTYHNQPANNFSSMNLDPSASIGSTVSEYSTTATETETEAETDWTNSNASNFDFYGAATYNTTSNSIGTPSTIPSTPKSAMTPPESPRTRTFSQSSGNQTPTPAKPQEQQQQQKKTEQNKSLKQKGGGGSWFRGLFSRFGGKNDVHLPDDRDNTIEWDEQKQKWINKDGDGDEGDGEVAPPPPSDSQLATTATPGVNKFSKRHVGRNYVDVFKPQSTTTSKSSSVAPPALFPTISNNTAPPVNFFTPTPALGDNQPQVGNPESQPSTPANEHNEQTHQPQFFNPNAYNGTSSNQYTPVTSLEPPQNTQENLSRTSSMSDLSVEVSQHLGGQGQIDQWDASSTPAVEPAQPAMPMMFNPQQFSQASFQPPMTTPMSSRSKGPGSRAYNQRRAYPTQK
ncbi:uncharacterized protein [Antedon mediterranea]|uniref:uncharacterized protein isoform X2 n=1 Tax=Antedon mediterranea TaxID=105859 RepID=UPI003AF63632